MEAGAPDPDPTRSIAYLLLHDVLCRRRTLEAALADTHRAEARSEPRDRAAAHRLAAAALRHAGTLDAVLEPHLRRAPPVGARLVLLLGAAQMLFLDTPPHAAVATAVALARRRKLAPFAGLVNAVLRRVAEAGAAALDPLDQPRLDTPAWLWTSWGKEARAIAEAHAREAPLDLTMRDGHAPPEGGAALPTGSIRMPPGTRVAALPGYAEGAFWVQDAAAAIPARLLAARPGERVADLCAAPGGKAAQLAQTGARVAAVERDPARLARLRGNLERLRLLAEPVLADVLEWSPGPVFDAILLDAPCSATGTIRRHPDLPHLKRPADLPMLAARQAEMVGAAARMLRPGGRLVCAVCSLQPEEAVSMEAAARHGLRPDPFAPDELRDLPQALTPNGGFRTHPGLWPERGGMDGFQAARLVKAG